MLRNQITKIKQDVMVLVFAHNSDLLISFFYYLFFLLMFRKLHFTALAPNVNGKVSLSEK